MATCVGCGDERDPDLDDDGARPPCPTCGETAVAFGVEAADELGLHDSLRVRLKGPDEKRAGVEQATGANFHRKSQTWSDVTRVIDRRNDRYVERIVDADGNVVRDVDVPLSEHRGHGSDRSQPKAHP